MRRTPPALLPVLMAAVSMLALAACATHEVDFQGEGAGLIGEGTTVHAVLETPSVGAPGQDAADDPAVFASATPISVEGHTVQGFVAGTDKKSGLYIYGLDGEILQFLPEGLLNNVDLVDGLLVDGRRQIVLGASDRTPGKIGVTLYLFDPAGTGANAVRLWGRIPTDVVEPYGFCFAKRGAAIDAILVGHESEVRQFALTASADGKPVAQELRRFEISTISEGCAADPETDALYLNEENVGLWRYGLNPASGAARTLIQPIAPGVLVADAEGLTTLADGEKRYLIASSQGDSTFPIWRIDGPAPVYVGRIVVRDGQGDGQGDGGGVDGVTGTDGIAALGGRVGDRFPEGLVVVQDDVNEGGTQNFKYIDWRDIRTALGL